MIIVFTKRFMAGTFPKIFFGIFFLLPESIFAQTHTNTWFRVTGKYEINNRFEFDLEVQHRRQQSYQADNPLGKDLMYSLRPWVHYRVKKDMRIDFSPLAYFSLYSIIRKESDEHKLPTEEYRTSLGLSLNHDLTKRLKLNARTLCEYRHFLGTNDVTRTRFRLGIDYKLNNRYAISVQDEILLNIGGVAPSHFFDQNRTSISLNRRFSKCSLELGYMFLKRLPANDLEYLKEHNLFINATIFLSHKIF